MNREQLLKVWNKQKKDFAPSSRRTFALNVSKKMLCIVQKETDPNFNQLAFEELLTFSRRPSE